VASIQKRPDGQWRARYRDDAGREHARHFARKVDAQRWLDAVTASLVTGTYVDPKLGKITYLSYYLVWSSRQVWVHHTRRAMDKQAQDVPFGDVALANIRSSHIESWVKAMSSTLAPLTIKQRVQNARTVLKAAMKDKVLGADPSLDVQASTGTASRGRNEHPHTLGHRLVALSCPARFRGLHSCVCVRRPAPR